MTLASCTSFYTYFVLSAIVHECLSPLICPWLNLSISGFPSCIASSWPSHRNLFLHFILCTCIVCSRAITVIFLRELPVSSFSSLHRFALNSNALSLATPWQCGDGADSLSLEDFLPQQTSHLFKNPNAIIIWIVTDFASYSQKTASTSFSQKICL